MKAPNTWKESMMITGESQVPVENKNKPQYQACSSEQEGCPCATVNCWGEDSGCWVLRVRGLIGVSGWYLRKDSTWWLCRSSVGHLWAMMETPGGGWLGGMAWSQPESGITLHSFLGNVYPEPCIQEGQCGFHLGSGTVDQLCTVAGVLGWSLWPSSLHVSYGMGDVLWLCAPGDPGVGWWWIVGDLGYCRSVGYQGSFSNHLVLVQPRWELCLHSTILLPALNPISWQYSRKNTVHQFFIILDKNAILAG